MTNYLFCPCIFVLAIFRSGYTHGPRVVRSFSTSICPRHVLLYVPRSRGLTESMRSSGRTTEFLSPRITCPKSVQFQTRLPHLRLNWRDLQPSMLVERSSSLFITRYTCLNTHFTFFHTGLFTFLIFSIHVLFWRKAYFFSTKRIFL